jgi:hypothetical protein
MSVRRFVSRFEGRALRAERGAGRRAITAGSAVTLCEPFPWRDGSFVEVQANVEKPCVSRVGSARLR